MAQYRITLRIEGAEPGQENVRLSDFLQELGALRTALRKTEEVITGHVILDWQIVDLSHASPATVSIEPIITRQHEVEPERPSKVVGGFFGYLRSLNASEAPPELDRTALDAFRELASPVHQHRVRTVISNGNETPVELGSAVETIIEAVLAPTMRAQASVKGRLEYLNIHDEQNVFRIYSEILPRFVVCHFPDAQLSTAKDAVGRKVKVSGEATYQSRDAYPRSIEVDTIEVLPEDTDLPRLLDLRGIAPDATGKLLSEDYVRERRGEE